MLIPIHSTENQKYSKSSNNIVQVKKVLISFILFTWYFTQWQCVLQVKGFPFTDFGIHKDHTVIYIENSKPLSDLINKCKIHKTIILV